MARTTELRPLHSSAIEENSSKLITSSPAKLNFSPHGTFDLIEKHLGVPYRRLMWAAQLLDFPSEQSVLIIDGGHLFVNNREEQVEILPQDIRHVAKKFTKTAMVWPSGFVLGDCDYPLGKTTINAIELEKILVKAEEGIDPLMYDPHIKVRVDQALSGKRVWLGIFESESIRQSWDRDAVVVDLKSRTMIPKEIVRPLAEEKWQRTSRRRLVHLVSSMGLKKDS